MSDFVHLREPFYSAGKKFKWPYKAPGLGINLQFLDGAGTLSVRVGDSQKVYTIDKEDARDLIYQYKSFFIAKNIKLGVVPWECFKVTLPYEPSVAIPPQEIKEDKELKLAL